MKYLLVAAASGLVYSLGSLILKTMVAGTSLPDLIINPVFILISIVFGFGGFVLSQVSIKFEKASQVWMLSTASANIVVMVGSFLFLGENMAVSEASGLALMLLGSFLLIAKKAK